MKIIKSIDDKRLQLSFYEKLIYIKRYFNIFIEKKLFNFHTNIVGTVRIMIRYDFRPTGLFFNIICIFALFFQFCLII